jgi:hypothetical protein
VVRLNFWIDKKVERERASSTQLTQRDRVEGGTVTEQVDATHIAVRLDGSELPDVVAPSESGVSAVGAWVRAIRDSTGRIAKFGIPDSIPSGAEQFSVGVTGERLVQLDATTAAQGAQLDVARGDLDAARARLDDPETGLDATQAKAQQAVDDAASAVTKAGSAADAASTAQNTADAKARTFTATPTAPYQVGDLWRNGNKAYVCTTTRASGSYTAADWALTADKTSENTAADTSKVGGTSAATVIQNIQTALANGKPFVQQATPSATAVGQLWFPTDADGHVIGMKVSTATGTGAWQDYTIMAGEILVPGSVGTTEIGPDGVLAANIKASNELSAKIASFLKVTTDMLIAGNATITGEMLVQELIGKILRGGLFEAGGGDLPMVRIGPLSGQVGVGDTYGVRITTPNNNAKGSATLSVSPAGPALEFTAADGEPALEVTSGGLVKVRNLTDGGLVDIAQVAASTFTWEIDAHFNLQFPYSGGSSSSQWSKESFFRAPWSEKSIGAVGQVSSPTGKLLIQSGISLVEASTETSGIQVQWGLFTKDPSGYAWDKTTQDRVPGPAFAPCSAHVSGLYSVIPGMQTVTVTPNQKYWLAPVYWTYNLNGLNPGTKTFKVNRMYVTVSPTT